MLSIFLFNVLFGYFRLKFVFFQTHLSLLCESTRIDVDEDRYYSCMLLLTRDAGTSVRRGGGSTVVEDN